MSEKDVHNPTNTELGGLPQELKKIDTEELWNMRTGLASLIKSSNLTDPEDITVKLFNQINSIIDARKSIIKR